MPKARRISAAAPVAIGSTPKVFLAASPPASRDFSGLGRTSDLDPLRLRLRSPWNGEVKHSVLQVRLNAIDVEIAGQGELSLKVTDLVLAIDQAVALRGLFIDAAVNGQDTLLQSDLQSVRT